MATSSTIAGARKIEIFKKRWAKRSARRVAQGLEIDIVAKNPWLVGLDCREYLSVAADWGAAAIYLGLVGGYDAVTGAPRPPSRDQDPRRMVRSGKFAKTIARSKVSGRVDKARCTIKGAKGPRRTLKMGSQEDPTLGTYEAALINESKRGHLYFRVNGNVGRAIQNGLADYLRYDLDGKVRPVSIGRRKATEIVATRSSMLTRGF
jgi:hypothetical protein